MPDAPPLPARLRSLWRPGRVPMVDAQTVLRGTGDAIAVLVLRSVRTSSWLVLAIGCGLVIRFLLARAAWLLAFRAMMRLPHGGDLAVRRQAVEQLGDLGQVLRLAETALRVASGLAFALFILLAGR